MDGTIDKLKGLLWAIVICAIISLLCGCKTRQSIIKERVVYDTVWTQKTQDRAKNDSVVYRERIVVQPHIIHVGDTTIVYSDTTIVRVAETNRYYTNNITSDKGKIIRDTVYVAPKTDNGTKVVTKTKNNWKLFWLGIIIGIVCLLVFKYRKMFLLIVSKFAKRGV